MNRIPDRLWIKLCYRIAFCMAVVPGVLPGSASAGDLDTLDLLDSGLADGVQIQQAVQSPTNPHLGTPQPWIERILAQPDASWHDQVAPTQTNAVDASSDPQHQILANEFHKLQNRLEELEASLTNPSRQNKRAIVSSGTSNSTVQIIGRIQIDALGFDTPNETDQAILTGFNGGIEPENQLSFRRLRLGAKGTVKDSVIYKFEADFADGDSEIRDAYLGFTRLPWFQTVLIGNQKRPIGLDALNSSRFNIFLERPLVIEAFNENERRLGVQFYGVSPQETWTWRLGLLSQIDVQQLGSAESDSLQLQLAGRLANTLWYDPYSGGRGYAHWGISGSHADVSDGPTNAAIFQTRPEADTPNPWISTGAIAGANHFEQLGVEGVLNIGSLQIGGEYQSLWLSRETGFEDVQFDGGYFYISYFLTGEHIPWNRQRGVIGRVIPHENAWWIDECNGCREAGWGAWQLAIRYGQADFTQDDIFGGEGESLTVALNWYWNANARVQINYIAGDVDNRDLGLGAGPQGASYDIWGARFSVDF